MAAAQPFMHENVRWQQGVQANASAALAADSNKQSVASSAAARMREGKEFNSEDPEHMPRRVIHPLWHLHDLLQPSSNGSLNCSGCANPAAEQQNSIYLWPLRRDVRAYTHVLTALLQLHDKELVVFAVNDNPDVELAAGGAHWCVVHTARTAISSVCPCASASATAWSCCCSAVCLSVPTSCTHTHIHAHINTHTHTLPLLSVCVSLSPAFQLSPNALNAGSCCGSAACCTGERQECQRAVISSTQQCVCLWATPHCSCCCCAAK